jgi:hypothetical protein
LAISHFLTVLLILIVELKLVLLIFIVELKLSFIQKNLSFKVGEMHSLAGGWIISRSTVNHELLVC